MKLCRWRWFLPCESSPTSLGLLKYLEVEVGSFLCKVTNLTGYCRVLEVEVAPIFCKVTSFAGAIKVFFKQR